jgi:hypothetical protein
MEDADSQARGSGRQHKAWGGAQRNPRLIGPKKYQPAERATVFTIQYGLSPAPRAAVLLVCTSWGYTAFHPRNYEAGSPKVDLKVGQCPTMETSLAFCRLTQNLT